MAQTLPNTPQGNPSTSDIGCFEKSEQDLALLEKTQRKYNFRHRMF